MRVTGNDRAVIAAYIIEEINKNFKFYHVSENLINTIGVEWDGVNFIIEIPAEIYDKGIWNRKGVVVYTGEGSYASDVDINGGYSGMHENFLQNSIDSALRRWVNERKLEGNLYDE